MCTAIIQGYWLDAYALELVYVAAFMVGMAAAMMLGKWTTKRLLIFIFVAATLLTVSKAARTIIDQARYQVYASSPV